MKRSSSEAVDENAWNDVQQEPAKKAKSDAVILQIDPTDNLAASNSTASGQNGNGHQNGHQNGHNVDAKNGSNGDAENGHTEDNWTLTGHLDDDVNGLLDDEIGKLEVENSLGTEEVIGLEVEEVVELETEDVPDAKKDQKETVEPQISQNLENKGEDAGSLKQQSSNSKTHKKGTWDQLKLNVTELTGHAYKVNAVDMTSKILVSASDDTTVKAWDIESKQEICTLSGHKEAVKAVQILDLAASKGLCEEGGNVVISGSTDCNAKFWHIPSGKELKSIYTFNAITCVGYISEEQLLVTATEGGKLELFDALTGTLLYSALAFELPVVSMKVYGGMIICGDPQCRLQVWIVKDKKLCCRRSSNGMETSRPNLSAISFYGTDNIIAGFFSGSVKKMSWANGAVMKIRSGKGDQVDSLQVVNELMVVATSKEDQSYLNFYNIPTGTYLGSAPGTTLMESVSAIRKEGFWHFATGGDKLQLWKSSSDLENMSDSDVMISVMPQPENISEDVSDSEDEDVDDAGKKESAGVFGGCSVM